MKRTVSRHDDVSDLHRVCLLSVSRPSLHHLSPDKKHSVLVVCLSLEGQRSHWRQSEVKWNSSVLWAQTITVRGNEETVLSFLWFAHTPHTGRYLQPQHGPGESSGSKVGVSEEFTNCGSTTKTESCCTSSEDDSRTDVVLVPRNEPETVLHPSRLHASSVRGLITACFTDNALFSFSLCFVLQISRGNMTSSGCLEIFSD